MIGTAKEEWSSDLTMEPGTTNGPYGGCLYWHVHVVIVALGRPPPNGSAKYDAAIGGEEYPVSFEGAHRSEMVTVFWAGSLGEDDGHSAIPITDTAEDCL